MSATPFPSSSIPMEMSVSLVLREISAFLMDAPVD
jgi:hypothetical protein